MNKLKIGVVGSGKMGKEIYNALFDNKYPVLLKARKEEDLDVFLTYAQKKFKKLLRRGKISEAEHSYLVANTVGTTRLDEQFADLDIVIETIVENSIAKKKLYGQLEEICSEETVICTNTSSLSVTDLSQGLQKKDRFLGLHFFQPFRAFKFIELVAGNHSSPKYINIACQLIESLKKYPFRVKDSPGYFFNRVQLTNVVEVFLALESGWHDIEVLNQTFKNSEFYVGIFEACDKLGLDLLEDCIINCNKLWRERYPLPELITRMTAGKRYGEKCGNGFYSYNGKQPVIDDEMQSILDNYCAERMPDEYVFSPEMGMLRIMNEGIYCLEEGIADISEAEYVMCTVPPFLFTNGFYRAMDKIGLDIIYKKLLEHEEKHGERYHPADLLKAKVRRGELGTKTGRGFFHY